MSTESTPHQIITVIDRKTISIDGVRNVLGFDEGYVSIMTDMGKIIIEGSELKIESLGKDEDTIHISGKINSIYYPQDKPGKKSIFKVFG